MTEEEIREELTAFCFKVDMEGFDYAVLNYGPEGLDQSVDPMIKQLSEYLDDALVALINASAQLEHVRAKYNIEES